MHESDFCAHLPTDPCRREPDRRSGNADAVRVPSFCLVFFWEERSRFCLWPKVRA